jgi:ElaB/YqjD/DUF883 family membrane-anchored ribosome-binding protein
LDAGDAPPTHEEHDMTTNTPMTGQQQGTGFADKAAESADAAIRSARQKANDAVDSLSDTMQGMKEKASATIERFRPQLDSVASYAKEEPTKAVLIAAAAGAGVMALIALSTRGSRTPSARKLSKLAADTVDEWRKAAADKSDSWRKAAGDGADRADSAIDSGRKAAQGAYEGLTDTMNQWKEQAASLVDKVRPQLDTVTDYAKDDPAKALLIAAAAGAALMGLVSSLTR